MSKKKHGYHPETVKRVEEITGKPIEQVEAEGFGAAIEATFAKDEEVVSVFPSDAEMRDLAAHVATVRAAERVSKLVKEEYLVQEVHFGDLQSRLNELAAEGRWRLHTVSLTNTYCRYVLVRESI